MSAPDDDEEPHIFTFSAELFLEWRAPRRGTANPERQDNPVWEEMIRFRKSAWSVNEQFDGPDSLDVGPGWCFHRFGQSETLLPDGRTVWISGEHEDHYDADFYIYNDVVVRHPDGSIAIYGYPLEVFPPTDSHSATLVGQQVVLIGCIGYSADRKPEVTPVYALDLETFSISTIETSGAAPGWLWGHQASLSADGAFIEVSGGEQERAGEYSTIVENIDTWRLSVRDWRWERLTDRCWPRWEIRRRDKRANHLYEIARLVRVKQAGRTDRNQEDLEELLKVVGREPDADVFESLYQPPITHERQPRVEDEYDVVRLLVDGVTVRYVERRSNTQITIEGDLPPETAEAIVRDFLEKFETLENSPCFAIEL